MYCILVGAVVTAILVRLTFQFAVSVTSLAPIVRFVPLNIAPVPDTVHPVNVCPVFVGLLILTVVPYVPLVGALLPFVPPFYS